VAERFPHGTVETITNRHLVLVRTPLIPEPLYVNDDDGPVNGQPVVLYLPSPREKQGRRKLLLTPKPISDQGKPPDLPDCQTTRTFTTAWRRCSSFSNGNEGGNSIT
jgi:hypothetical protein